ncbi:MAG: PEP-CTERM sorting domain-containing protein [Planctomycetes bacterium]|nr:PEP-CTERM sorting domain-containing protein [Planctomycetota bacterium]
MKVSLIRLTVLAGLAMAGNAFAAGTSFATATPNAGPGTVSGALDASGNRAAVFGTPTLFATYADQNRVAGAVDTFNITGLTAGGAVRAAMRQATNPAGGLYPTWDSYLRMRNTGGTVLATNDDDGPGALSAMLSPVTIPANGSVQVQITGYADRNTFTGADSTNVGRYDLDIFASTIITPRQYGVNVQWWAFSGLAAGTPIVADINGATGNFTDSYLAVFDSAGNMLFGDDDTNGLFSAVLASDNILVPGNGIVYAAVTSYQGTIGAHTNPASYLNENENSKTGTFNLNLVPAPGSLALLGLGGLIAGRRRRA